jgi:hypothetical protein
MPKVNEDVLRAEDQILDTLKDMPYRFGFNHFVSLNPENSGVWDEFEDGSKMWRIGIASNSAKSINLTFDKYRLPEGAKLFIYNVDRTQVLGAFTSANNQEDGYFSTTLINGDAIIIEYCEPANVEFAGELNLWRVTHGYRGPAEFMRDFGTSGDCNMNVVCPTAVPYENQVRSVAMMVTGGSGFCTGSLINNALNDGKPYFLTANHCYSDPGTWVFWFNWQSPTCTNPASNPSYNSISGATLRAKNAASDFCLVEINSAIPESFNAYWAGWNRTTDASLSEQIIGVHHPDGDIKKFSYATAGVTTTAYLGGAGTDHWEIQWSGGTTTEGGSSGSGLFDANGRLIGQLHGGYAACGNTDLDYYGKLGISWTGGGSNSTRLSNWLDPSNTGVTVLDGVDPFAVTVTIDAAMFGVNTPAASYSAVQQITPQVVIKNIGTSNLLSASVSYTIDGGSPVTTVWNGTLTTGQTANVSFNPIDLTVGNHVFVATVTVASDENTSNNTFTKNYSVSDCATSISTFPHSESFNAATFPLCWTSTVLNAANTWALTTGYTIGTTTPTTVSPQEGSHFFFVQWIAQDQEEWLISPNFNFTSLSAPQISFWFNGSFNWAVTNPNCDLDLLVSIDGGAWTQLWNESDHPTFIDDAATYTWLNTVLDLSAYQGLDNVKFAFRYTGNDGANFGVDNIVIDGTITEQFTLTVNVVGQGTVNVDAAPYTAPVVVDAGTSLSLQAIPNSGWSFDVWSNGLTGTANPQNIIMNANKTVTATFIDAGTSINQNSNAFGVKLYPNPASKNLNIVSDSQINTVVITSIIGQVVFEKEYNSSEIQLDVNEFANGSYLIKVYTENNVSTHKLQIAK